MLGGSLRHFQKVVAAGLDLYAFISAVCIKLQCVLVAVFMWHSSLQAENALSKQYELQQNLSKYCEMLCL